MNTLRLTILALAITTFLSVSAIAQTGGTVYVNTTVFYEDKIGITKLVTATKQIETEFAVKIKELTEIMLVFINLIELKKSIVQKLLR